MRYEYTVVPAPSRGEKVRGAKSATDRYAVALAAELNRMAAAGWDYVRAEVLPSEERSGLTGRATVYHNILVFRRPLAELDQARPPARVASPQPEYPVEATAPAGPRPIPDLPQAAAPQPADHKAVSAPTPEPAPKADTPADAPATPPPPRVGPSA